MLPTWLLQFLDLPYAPNLQPRLLALRQQLLRHPHHNSVLYVWTSQWMAADYVQSLILAQLAPV